MRALIVDDRFKRLASMSKALLEAGFQVTNTYSIDEAIAFTKQNLVDLLITPEIVHEARSHALALLAEHRNPLVATIFLTNRKDQEVDELFLLLPSLHCLLAEDIAPDLAAKFAVASVCGIDGTHAPLVLSPTARVKAPTGTPTFVSVRAKTAATAKPAIPNAA